MIIFTFVFLISTGNPNKTNRTLIQKMSQRTHKSIRIQNCVATAIVPAAAATAVIVCVAIAANGNNNKINCVIKEISNAPSLWRLTANNFICSHLCDDLNEMKIRRMKQTDWNRKKNNSKFWLDNLWEWNILISTLKSFEMCSFKFMNKTLYSAVAATAAT